MAEEIATLAADQPAPGGGRLLDDPAFARKLADARIRTEVREILEYRVLAVSTARDVARRAGVRLRATAGRLRQRRRVAGGRTIALLQ